MTITSKPPILRAAALLSIGAAMALSACGGSGDVAEIVAGSSTTVARSATSSTTSRAIAATSSSSTTEPDAESDDELTREDAERQFEILDAYSDFWRNYVDVGKGIAKLDAAAIRPKLAEYATGDVLDQLDAFFTVNQKSGFVMRDGINLKYEVVALRATMAQVRDCQEDKTGLYRADGSRVDWEMPLRRELLTTLILEDGWWKVSAIRNEGEACDA